MFKVLIDTILSAPMSQEEVVPQGSVLSFSMIAVAIHGILDVVPTRVFSSLHVGDLPMRFSGYCMCGVHPYPDLNFSSSRLHFVSESKFLGLIFESHLTWISHVIYL